MRKDRRSDEAKIRFLPLFFKAYKLLLLLLLLLLLQIIITTIAFKLDAFGLLIIYVQRSSIYLTNSHLF